MAEKQKNHPCTHVGCSQSFNRPYRLAQHLLSHNNVKAFSCKEENCAKSYTSKSHLDRHIKSVHKTTVKNIVYSCPKCLKTYSNRQNLKRHIKITHNLKVPFSCDYCRLEFQKKNQLSAHMFQHTGIRSFSCDMCSEDFITLYEKKRHMRYHKTYTCETCELVFNHWSKYQKHKREHNIKEFICNECNRKFNQRSHIVRHVKIHKENVVAKKIACSYPGCNREYSRSTFLRHHVITKHQKFKLKCTVCQTGLATKAKLNLHMVLHSSDTESKPKKIKTSRKERKDKGSMKYSTAMKLAGLVKLPKDTESFTPQNFVNSLLNEDFSSQKKDILKQYDAVIFDQNAINSKDTQEFSKEIQGHQKDSETLLEEKNYHSKDTEKSLKMNEEHTNDNEETSREIKENLYKNSNTYHNIEDNKLRNNGLVAIN